MNSKSRVSTKCINNSDKHQVSNDFEIRPQPLNLYEYYTIPKLFQLNKDGILYYIYSCVIEWKQKHCCVTWRILPTMFKIQISLLIRIFYQWCWSFTNIWRTHINCKRVQAGLVWTITVYSCGSHAARLEDPRSCHNNLNRMRAQWRL